MNEFSVLTYNMHKGFSAVGQRKLVLDQMRESIASAASDVVFLQEAQGEHHHHARRYAEWPDNSQFEYIADELWPHYAYGKNAIYDHGHHGNAILSKFPFFEWENLPLSPYPFAASRSLLHGHAEMPDSGTRLHLVCVHLGFIGMERRRQIAEMRRYVDRTIPNDEPLVIAGDFNDWSGRGDQKFHIHLGLREAHRERHGRFAATYPAWSPLLPLDRIYYRNLELTITERFTKGPWRALSDHTPIKASFRV